MRGAAERRWSRRAGGTRGQHRRARRQVVDVDAGVGLARAARGERDARAVGAERRLRRRPGRRRRRHDVLGPRRHVAHHDAVAARERHPRAAARDDRLPRVPLGELRGVARREVAQVDAGDGGEREVAPVGGERRLVEVAGRRRRARDLRRAPVPRSVTQTSSAPREDSEVS